MTKPTDLVQGTLDLLILKTIALEPMHGWAIAQRIRLRIEECPASESRRALSRFASPRTASVDSGQVGRVGK